MYTEIVKNITLSADETLIERGRLRAAREKKTLNSAFREWLERYAGADGGSKEYKELTKRFAHVKTTRSFSREERNER
ncbi:MAG TPA: hypothetical protein VGL97_25345 [Bryobacteraceae bacterium]